MSFTDYDKCSLLLPMNGSNGGTTFTDWSPTTKTVTANGNAQTSTAKFKYYDSSGAFDGTGDYLEVANTSSYVFSTDFTICLYANFSSVSSNQPLVSKWGGATASINSFLFYYVQSTGMLAFDFRKNDGTTYISTVRSSWSPSTSIWYNIVLTRVGNVYRLFVDGTQLGSDITETATINTGSSNIQIASYTAASSVYLTGNLQDVIIINGAALWTSNFTPPTRLIGEISGTVYDKDGAVASRSIIAVPRSYPSKVYSTTSSAGDGTYSLTVPATEMSVIGLANESVLREDKIERVIPE